MKPIRRYLKNRKGIQTILAALLMVVIVVVAAVMVYAWSTGLLGTLLVQPNVGKEALGLDNTGGSFTGTMNVTLYLRNQGSTPISLQSYYVKDSAGDQYQLTTGFSAGPINPSAAIPVNLLINSQCTGCVLTGSAFQFQPGNSYTAIVVTTRNNQFSFTVTK